MNKWQIICPVAAMALVAVLGLAGQARRNARYNTTAQTEMIGQDLIRATNSPRLSASDSALQNRLAAFLASPSGVAEVRLGDEPPPIGDGTACSRLVLSNSAGDRLGIRFRQAGPGDFHALSFWTLTEPNGPATGSQPVRSGATQPSGAAGSGR
jgi:hypothetical protein